MILGSTEPRFVVSRGGTYDICVCYISTMRMDPTLFPPSSCSARFPLQASLPTRVFPRRCFFFSIYLFINCVAEPYVKSHRMH